MRCPFTWREGTCHNRVCSPLIHHPSRQYWYCQYYLRYNGKWATLGSAVACASSLIWQQVMFEFACSVFQVQLENVIKQLDYGPKNNQTICSMHLMFIVNYCMKSVDLKMRRCLSVFLTDWKPLCRFQAIFSKLIRRQQIICTTSNLRPNLTLRAILNMYHIPC